MSAPSMFMACLDNIVFETVVSQRCGFIYKTKRYKPWFRKKDVMGGVLKTPKILKF